MSVDDEGSEYQDRMVAETLARLERVWPHSGWEYESNFLVYRETLWLQFSCASERRMYWVWVEDSEEVVRTWDLSEVCDLI